MSEPAAQRIPAASNDQPRVPLDVVPERRGTWRIDHGRKALSRNDDRQAALAEARRLAEDPDPPARAGL